MTRMWRISLCLIDIVFIYIIGAQEELESIKTTAEEHNSQTRHLTKAELSYKKMQEKMVRKFEFPLYDLDTQVYVLKCQIIKLIIMDFPCAKLSFSLFSVLQNVTRSHEIDYYYFSFS